MELNQIEYFLHVAQTEHMSKAAEELFMSQSSLSIAIKNLEKELGVPLFDKCGRNIKLNNYGREFYNWATKIVYAVNEGVNSINKMKEDEQRTLRLISPHIYTMGGLLEDLYATIPDIVINCSSCNYKDIDKQIEKGAADMGFLISPIETDACNYQVVYEYDWSFLISEKHPLSNKQSISLKDCSDLLFVAPSPTTGQRYYFDKAFSDAGIEPHIVREIDSYHTTVEAVKGGHVAALFCNVVLLPVNVSGVKWLKIEDPVEKGTLRLYWPNNRPEKEYAKRARSIIIDKYKSL